MKVISDMVPESVTLFNLVILYVISKLKEILKQNILVRKWQL